MTVIVPEDAAPSALSATDAFSDFLDLRTAVVEHVGRADIADVFPRLVALAESRLNREFRTKAQVATATVTISAGRGTLPSDTLEIIGVYAANGAEYVMQSPQNVAYNSYYYSVEGDDIVTSLLSGDVRVDYYASIPSLNDTLTTSNWLLSRYPDVYLYSVAFEAAKHVRDIELAQATKALMDDATINARADDQRRRYARARVRVAGVTP
jgi:hypothetical protein